MKITQSALATIIKKRGKVAKLQTEIDGLEAKLFGQLKNGAEVSRGLFTAFIHRSERRNPSWRVEFEQAIDARDGLGEGKIAAEAILEATPKSVSEKLKVEAVA